MSTSLSAAAGMAASNKLETKRTPSHGLPSIWLPAIFLLAASIAIRIWNLDLIVGSRFWSDNGTWTLENLGFVQFLYHYGVYPALIVAGGCLIGWSWSFFDDRLRKARFLTGFLVGALILGPGLLVNVVLKDHFGRPRPRQTENFGGDRQFSPLGKPTFKSREKSFPSGHASMGFFWFAPAIYYWSRSRRLAWGLIALGLIHGGLMGFARMAQGAHWISDILWSGGIVYLSSWILYRVLEKPSSSPPALVIEEQFSNSGVTANESAKLV